MSTRERRPDLHPDHPLDLLRPATLKELCVRAGIRPDRKSGQNFLINRATLERIVAAVNPQPGDTILEVGAGFGVLTLALAERLAVDVPPLRVRGGEGELRAVRNPSQPSTRTSSMLGRPPLTPRGGDTGRVIAIERDRHITPILHELARQNFAAQNLGGLVMPYGNVEVWEQDVLQMLRAAVQQGRAAAGQGGSRAAEPLQLQQGAAALRLFCTAAGWKLAANLPYGITSDFLRLLFDAVGTGALPPPERAVLLLQREVVDRMCADPSRHSEHRNVGLLTILTQLHCSPRRITRVPAAHFWPAPKVESAVVVLDAWRTPEGITGLLVGPTRDEFLHVVRTCFAHRRRQIGRLLKSHASSLTPQVSSLNRRPETLTLAQWIALARVIKEKT